MDENILVLWRKYSTGDYVRSVTLTYGDAVYEVVRDAKNLNKDALLFDSAKNTGLYIGEKLADKAKVPKHILIPIQSGIKIYVNAQYKETGEKEYEFMKKKDKKSEGG